jgi:hypothetical protein
LASSRRYIAEISGSTSLILNSKFPAPADGILNNPLLVPVPVVVVTVALRSPTGTNSDPELDLILPLLKYPLMVGVPLLRDSIVIDIIDIAEPGRGLGLGLGGCPPSESSEVPSEEGEYRPGLALAL